MKPVVDEVGGEEQERIKFIAMNLIRHAGHG